VEERNVSREDLFNYGKSEGSTRETFIAYKGTGRKQETVKVLAGICE
jgi:hypothetical protein